MSNKSSYNNIIPYIKINDLISYGMKGTVYNSDYNNKSYAYKIEHILKTEMKKQQNEINFSLKFANKFPNHFISLYDYQLIKNCNHKQQYSYDLKQFPDKKYYLKLAKSNLCMAKLYSLIDGTLDSIFDSLNINQKYSLLIQLTYIFYLLHKFKFSHNDIHSKNIGFVKTNQPFIKIFNLKIPLYGYLFKLIDFGNVSTKINHKQPELFSLLFFTINTNLDNYNINWKKSDNIIQKSPEFSTISSFINYNFLSYFLFLLIHTDKYYSIRINKIISPEFFIPQNQIINIILLMNNLEFKKIILYLFSLLS
jgi:hypothetical protein